jgi:hypothetical protein
MEFVLSIDRELFQSTNAPWNNFKLNIPWSVGYVSYLIESRPFESKEDWEQFYYQSGEERDARIAELDEFIQDKLNNHDFSKSHGLSKSYQDLNFMYGRTRPQLMSRGQILFNIMKKMGSPISLEECCEAVRFRVIGETWNGIIVRERNTIRTISGIISDVEFRKMPAKEDYKYSVDYEVFKSSKLIGALQIKPQSYRSSNASYVEKAKQANADKHSLYKSIKGIDVQEVIAELNGFIDRDDMEKIIKTLS